jgi:hypothetical protein
LFVFVGQLDGLTIGNSTREFVDFFCARSSITESFLIIVFLCGTKFGPVCFVSILERTFFALSFLVIFALCSFSCVGSQIGVSSEGIRSSWAASCRPYLPFMSMMKYMVSDRGRLHDYLAQKRCSLVGTVFKA